jgi:hypothetical protein
MFSLAKSSILLTLQRVQVAVSRGDVDGAFRVLSEVSKVVEHSPVSSQRGDLPDSDRLSIVSCLNIDTRGIVTLSS